MKTRIYENPYNGLEDTKTTYDSFSNKLTFEFKNRLDLHCFDMYMNEYGHEMDGGYTIFNIHSSNQI